MKRKENAGDRNRLLHVLSDEELAQVAGGRPPIPIIDWEASTRFLAEDDRYLQLPASSQGTFLYYLKYHEYAMIGDLIEQDILTYGEDYPILQEAYNKSVIGYR